MSELRFPDMTKEKMIELAIELNNIINPDKMCFDFSQVNWVEPFGMLYAGMIIKKYFKKNPYGIYSIKCDENLNATTYAEHMGFFKFISENINLGKSPGEANGNCNYMPITKINFQEEFQEFTSNGYFLDMGEIIENKSKELSKIISQGNVELEIVLSYCLREMIRNISEHSEANDAWVCGQYWPTKEKAEIGIVDEGIGLKKSLSKNSFHREYILDDKDAIQFAVKPGISRAFSPRLKNNSDDVWSNSGFGLYMNSTLCKELGGKFYLSSGKKCLIIDKNSTNFYDTEYQGVAIGLELPTNIVEAKEIIRNISIEGENEAKKIRNTFKKASKPSKGLIID